MPTRIILDLWGDTQLDRTLADMGERVGDMRPVWNELADRFAVIERRQFETEGLYGSGGWDPLSPRYAAWKASHYPGKTILRREDDLFESLTVRPFGIEVLEETFMVLGSGVEYGAYHQRGDGQKQRRAVELPDSERAEWLRAMQRYIMTGEGA